MKTYANDTEKEVKLMKTGMTVEKTALPNITVNPGLDATRQWYLYEEVRPYCPSPLMEQVCPRPSVPKPVHVVKEEVKRKK